MEGWREGGGGGGRDDGGMGGRTDGCMNGWERDGWMEGRRDRWRQGHGVGGGRGLSGEGQVWEEWMDGQEGWREGQEGWREGGTDKWGTGATGSAVCEAVLNGIMGWHRWVGGGQGPQRCLPYLAALAAAAAAAWGPTPAGTGDGGEILRVVLPGLPSPPASSRRTPPHSRVRRAEPQGWRDLARPFAWGWARLPHLSPLGSRPCPRHQPLLRVHSL